MYNLINKLDITAYIRKLVKQFETKATEPITTVSNTLQKTYRKLKTNHRTTPAFCKAMDSPLKELTTPTHANIHY